MTAHALGLELNKKKVDLDAGDHLKPEFVKLNPQHTIPTLVDGEFAVWESRAILIYLAEKYDKDGSIYPKDPQQRAVINQRLFFDLGTLYQSYVYYYYPQLFEDVKKPADPENFKKIDAAFEMFNTLLCVRVQAKNTIMKQYVQGIRMEIYQKAQIVERTTAQI